MTAELNRSLDRPFLDINAGRPHLSQSYPSWRLICQTKNLLRFRPILHRSFKVDRFSTLPPEIRTRIYEHYFRSCIGPMEQPVTCFEHYKRSPIFHSDCRYDLLAALGEVKAQPAEHELRLTPAIFDTAIDHPLYRASLDKLYFERGLDSSDDGLIMGLSPLLGVSRLINSEAAPMLYGAVQFDTTSLSSWALRPQLLQCLSFINVRKRYQCPVSLATNFLRIIGAANRRRIRHLSLLMKVLLVRRYHTKHEPEKYTSSFIQ